MRSSRSFLLLLPLLLPAACAPVPHRQPPVYYLSPSAPVVTAPPAGIIFDDSVPYYDSSLPGLTIYERYYVPCDCIMLVYEDRQQWYEFGSGRFLHRGPWPGHRPSALALQRREQMLPRRPSHLQPHAPPPAVHIAPAHPSAPPTYYSGSSGPFGREERPPVPPPVLPPSAPPTFAPGHADAPHYQPHGAAPPPRPAAPPLLPPSRQTEPATPARPPQPLSPAYDPRAAAPPADQHRLRQDNAAPQRQERPERQERPFTPPPPVPSQPVPERHFGGSPMAAEPPHQRPPEHHAPPPPQAAPVLPPPPAPPPAAPAAGSGAKPGCSDKDHAAHRC